jgi:hypothetical protein
MSLMMVEVGLEVEKINGIEDGEERIEETEDQRGWRGSYT